MLSAVQSLIALGKRPCSRNLVKTMMSEADTNIFELMLSVCLWRECVFRVASDFCLAAAVELSGSSNLS